MNPSRTLSLFVFVDALGWAIYQRANFLEGVTRRASPVDSVLGYSSTCIPSILTGLKPKGHGHFSFFHYDPASSPFRALAPLSRLPAWAVDRGRVRQWISRGVKRAFGYSGYFQLYSVPFEHLPQFDYGEKRDLYQPGGVNSGVLTAFDVIRARGIPHHISDWRDCEVDNIAALKAAMSGAQPPAFAYLYLADLDGILHENGSVAVPVTRKIAWYDKQIREVLAKAGQVYSSVRLHVFSDHGMADIHEIVDLIAEVEKTGLVFGRDYVAMYDATMARFWLLRSSARPVIERCLGATDGGRVLSREEIVHYGCDFEDGREGDLLFLTDPGVLICPSFMGKKPVRGMHGYEPTHEDSLAFYATNVDGTPAPRSLTDYYDLLVNEATRAAGAVEPGLRGAA